MPQDAVLLVFDVFWTCLGALLEGFFDALGTYFDAILLTFDAVLLLFTVFWSCGSLLEHFGRPFTPLQMFIAEGISLIRG